MKLVIQKYLNRIELIKFIRSRENLELYKAVDIVNNLPYAFEFLSKVEADFLQKKISGFATSLIEDEEDDKEVFVCFNQNINPPQEYIDAVAWEESLTDQQKQYIDAIVKWRSRPAVC